MDKRGSLLLFRKWLKQGPVPKTSGALGNLKKEMKLETLRRVNRLSDIRKT